MLHNDEQHRSGRYRCIGNITDDSHFSNHFQVFRYQHKRLGADPRVRVSLRRRRRLLDPRIDPVVEVAATDAFGLRCCKHIEDICGSR